MKSPTWQRVPATSKQSSSKMEVVEEVLVKLEEGSEPGVEVARTARGRELTTHELGIPLVEVMGCTLVELTKVCFEQVNHTSQPTGVATKATGA